MPAVVKLYYLASRAAIVAIVAFILCVSLPFNPLSEHLHGEGLVRAFVPEGWAFFTRNPREPRLEIYYRANGRWIPNPLVPMGKPSNIFGLWRKVRAQSVELAILLPQIPKTEWTELPKGFAISNTGSSPAVKVTNPSPYPVLPDTIAVVKHDPVPWSYARMVSVDSLPCRYVFLSISPPHE